MLTFEKFTGINNVLPSHRLGTSDLSKALNVDVGLTRDLSRRDGFVSVDATCHKNLHQRPDGVLLATRSGNELIARSPAGAETEIHPLLGPARVWYCDLPDGRTVFSNGAIAGVTDGVTATACGIPVPVSVGVAVSVAGDLAPGSYRWAVTFVRDVDGQEGAAAYSAPVELEGGVVVSDLPSLAGHKARVYLSGKDGEMFYLAGDAVGTMFAFSGRNEELIQHLPTEGLLPMPVGTVSAFWRGRLLMAEGDTLWASLPHVYELVDKTRDFKRFPAPITGVVAVDGGIWVGTTEGLHFLSGVSFDALTDSLAVAGRVVLGSAIQVPGQMVGAGDGTLSGDVALCICDGIIVAGSADGQVVRITEGRYKVDVQEVWSTFRMVNRLPQYVAVKLA